MSIESAPIHVRDRTLRWEQARAVCVAECAGLGLQHDSQPSTPNELRWVAVTAESVVECAQQLARLGYFLVTLVGNDERGLRRDARYCVYYIYAHPDADLFVSVAHALPAGDESYPSIRPVFAAAEPFEREIADLLGLKPRYQPAPRAHGARLHAPSYPERLFPLRRDHSLSDLRKLVARHYAATRRATHMSRPHIPSEHHNRSVADGQMLLPVGPIHAGVIAPGFFLFTLEGKQVAHLEIELGYTHKGLERLFQEFAVGDGRGERLAEFVATDMSFAHSLAYCRAVERLTDVGVPWAAQVTRAVLLELERIANHVGDIGGLATDVGRGMVASEMGVLREHLLELCHETARHRLLLNVNVPGGVRLREPLNQGRVRESLSAFEPIFLRWCRVLDGWGFRRRACGVGVLDAAAATRLGVTGIAASAVGMGRDSRVLHAETDGVYADPAIQALLQSDAAHVSKSSASHSPRAAQFRHAGARAANSRAGDVHARFLVRVEQVLQSLRLVHEWLDRWGTQVDGGELRADLTFPVDLQRQIALGYAEGWRGDVSYWLMVDERGQIQRCKVRDPSMLNWPAVELAVQGDSLVDFPLINKSFNLSYSGNDL